MLCGASVCLGQKGQDPTRTYPYYGNPNADPFSPRAKDYVEGFATFFPGEQLTGWQFRLHKQFARDARTRNPDVVFMGDSMIHVRLALWS